MGCGVCDGVLVGDGDCVDVSEGDGVLDGDAVAVLLLVGDPVWLELPVPVRDGVAVVDSVQVELADPVPV